MLKGAMDDLGLDYVEGDGVSVVEWSQFVGDEIPADKLIVHLKKDDDNDYVHECGWCNSFN